MVLCHICPFVFRLLKDNPGIEDRRRVKVPCDKTF